MKKINKKAKLETEEKTGLFEVFGDDITKIIFSHLIPVYNGFHFDPKYHINKTQPKNTLEYIECNLCKPHEEFKTTNDKCIKTFLSLRTVSKEFQKYIDNSIEIIGPNAIDCMNNYNWYGVNRNFVFCAFRYIALYFFFYLKKHGIYLNDWLRETELYGKPFVAMPPSNQGVCGTGNNCVQCLNFDVSLYLYLICITKTNINKFVNKNIISYVVDTMCCGTVLTQFLWNVNKHKIKVNDKKTFKEDKILQLLITGWNSYKYGENESHKGDPLYQIIYLLNDEMTSDKESMEEIVSTLGVENIMAAQNLRIFTLSHIFETECFKTYVNNNRKSIKKSLGDKIDMVDTNNEDQDKIGYKIYRIMRKYNLC